jgi:predicted nucleic acid-binding protein
VIVTLDASVWLASLLVDEPAHQFSNAAVTVLQQGGHRLIQPPLFLVEVAATVARRTGQPALGLDALAAVLALAPLEVTGWTSDLNASAATLAARWQLRAGAACYLATAQVAGAVLVTNDRARWQRGRGAAPVLTPDEWLAASPGG